MNSNDNQRDLAGELGRGLRDRVSGLHDAPFDLEDVKGRAGEIRRRRRITTAIAATAVAAVVVPTAFLVAPALNTSGEIPPAGPSPTIVEPRPGDTELDVSDLPQGDAPAIPYVVDGVVHQPDGSQDVLETDGRVTGFHLTPDGRQVVATADDDGNWFVEVVAGGSATSYPLVGSLAVDATGDRVAWATPDGEILVLQAELPEPPVEIARIEGQVRSVVAVTGADCTEPGGCTVHADVQDPETGEGQSWVVSSPGANGGGPPHVIGVADVWKADSGMPEGGIPKGGMLLAGMVELTDDGSCSQIIDVRRGAPVLETCDNRFGQFSPDGRHVLAIGAYGSGIGEGEVGMYDVEAGERLWHRIATGPDSAFVHTHIVWEDEEHALAMAHQDGQWSVVRLGLDGSMEQALPPVSGEDVEPAYLLETRP